MSVDRVGACSWGELTVERECGTADGRRIHRGRWRSLTPLCITPRRAADCHDAFLLPDRAVNYTLMEDGVHPSGPGGEVLLRCILQGAGLLPDEERTRRRRLLLEQ